MSDNNNASTSPVTPETSVPAPEVDEKVVGSELATVIVPAAGLGTRFLPATKTVPKELLPVVDTPGIEYIAEEAAEAGATRLAIITAPKKSGLMAHFDTDEDLESVLQERGKDEQLAKVQRAANLIKAVEVVQEQPLGLGHAVAQAESVLGDNEAVVAVMLPDDLVLPTGIMKRMQEIRARFGGSVLCAVEVDETDVKNYGVFDVSTEEEEDVFAVTGMVEKPEPEEAPSRLAATGRYLLDRDIFDALARTKPGKGGEIQLTDAIELLIREGHPVHVCVHRGTRHDLGNPGGFIKACIDYGLRSDEYGRTIGNYIRKRMAQEDGQA